MLVSIVIPAYRAEHLIGEAVQSVIAQALTDWECIVVSDDGVDYRAILELQGLADPRLRYVSTGQTGSGCHAARNRGLKECRGEIICALDADDVWKPHRLAVLAPQALQHGAAVDGPRVVDTTGSVLYTAFDAYRAPFMLDLSELLALTCPIFPLTRRDLTFARKAGIEHLEDIVSNLLLISSNGPMWATPESLMDYRVVTGSMCHGDESAARFDRAYADIIALLRNGDSSVEPALHTNAIAGLEQKRALNKRFIEAQSRSADLDFQTFVAARSRKVAKPH
jgi:glycosyltransferase involved in cell wall biosynthesis